MNNWRCYERKGKDSFNKKQYLRCCFVVENRSKLKEIQNGKTGRGKRSEKAVRVKQSKAKTNRRKKWTNENRLKIRNFKFCTRPCAREWWLRFTSFERVLFGKNSAHTFLRYPTLALCFSLSLFLFWISVNAFAEQKPMFSLFGRNEFYCIQISYLIYSKGSKKILIPIQLNKKI